MKTYLAKVGEIDRKHVVFDAANVPVGRLAVKIVNALRGKDCPTYTPHVDTGKFVIVINADKALLTGAKESNKIYVDYTGYSYVESDELWDIHVTCTLAESAGRHTDTDAQPETTETNLPDVGDAE